MILWPQLIALQNDLAISYKLLDIVNGYQLVVTSYQLVVSSYLVEVTRYSFLATSFSY